MLIVSTVNLNMFIWLEYKLYVVCLYAVDVVVIWLMQRLLEGVTLRNTFIITQRLTTFCSMNVMNYKCITHTTDYI